MDKVYVATCDHYDISLIQPFLAKVVSDYQAKLMLDDTKTVFIKLNLLTDRTPEECTTTHPIFTQALIKVLKQYGCKIILGDSPAGKANKARMDVIYDKTGYRALAKAEQVELCYDMTAIKINNIQQVKTMHDADIVINACKMKTHSLTTFTGAVKNCFGSVPEDVKYHQHALHPITRKFCEYLIKVAETLKPEFSIMDGIMAMSKNGPSNGEPYPAGLMLASDNPYALDHYALLLLQIPNNLVHTDLIAKKKGLYGKVELVSDKALKDLLRYDFQLPDSSTLLNKMRETKLPRFEPELCIGCQACYEGCPQQTIIMVDNKAKLKPEKCIKCYCCQEICPVNAIKID
ncbi:MAG: DUF362 domain-containing protein [Erysipelotrichaceae bacterium]|nr:DUF362 domain-containing protein [Erysipelotrichaceae bacterium]